MLYHAFYSKLKPVHVELTLYNQLAIELKSNIGSTFKISEQHLEYYQIYDQTETDQ